MPAVSPWRRQSDDLPQGMMLRTLRRCVAVRSSGLLLGIDVGTSVRQLTMLADALVDLLCHIPPFGEQGAKAIVYDPARRAVLSRSSQDYDILPSDVPGRAEQWPSSWTDAAFAAAARALDACDRAAVRAIGVSGQQHSLVSCSEHWALSEPACMRAPSMNL